MIANGFTRCPDGTGLDSVCRFMCSFGYQLDGSVISNCVQIGAGALKWDPNVPSCEGMAVFLLIFLHQEIIDQDSC